MKFFVTFGSTPTSFPLANVISTEAYLAAGHKVERGVR